MEQKKQKYTLKYFFNDEYQERTGEAVKQSATDLLYSILLDDAMLRFDLQQGRNTPIQRLKESGFTNAQVFWEEL